MCKTRKVLIFTNLSSWSDCISNRIRITNWCSNYPNDDNNPVYQCADANGTLCWNQVILGNITAAETNRDGVYLVFDNINDKNFQQLIKMCAGNELYVLTHSQGRSQDGLGVFNQWANTLILPGTHSSYPAQHYYTVFKILHDTENDKLNRIINEVFKPQLDLETVLRFLHGCLGDSRSTGLDDSYQALSTIPSIGKSVTDFYNTYFNSDTYNGHNDKIEKLAKLRDKLLEHVLTGA